MNLTKLTDIGFKKIGSWSNQDEKLVPNLSSEQDSRNVLYSFVLNNEPVYIGKTTQKFKKRMYGYQNPGKTQFTNIRNNKNIKDALSNNHTVDIYVLPDNGLLHFGEFHLNLAAGLEDNITKTLKPIWNISGK